MGNRAKRIDLADLPGAKENGIQWMMCSGVRSRAEAEKAARAFIADVAEVRGGAPSQLHQNAPAKTKIRSK